MFALQVPIDTIILPLTLVHLNSFRNYIFVQPTPDVFYSFEDVIVMADGQIIYHGMYIISMYTTTQ